MIKVIKNFILIKLRLNSLVGFIYFQLSHLLAPCNPLSLAKIVVWECSAVPSCSFFVSLVRFYLVFFSLFLVLMDTLWIVCLCSSLLMKEKAVIVVVSDEVQQQGDAMTALCLLGKILTSKSFNNDVFVRSILMIWKFKKGIRVEHTKHFFFLLLFRLRLL